MELRPILTNGRYFESPRWHRGRLWFVDSLGRTLLAIDESGSAPETVCTIDGIPSGLGFLPDGSPIVVSMFDRRLVRVENGQAVLHVDLSKVSAGTLDDMVIDTEGRIYVGDLGTNLTQSSGDLSAPIGRILLITPDGSTRIVAEGLRFPNGIAISGDGRALSVAESNGDCLARYDVQSDGGLIFKDRIGHFGEPDGICTDAEGATWVALFKEDSFVRIDLSGKITDRIATPDGRGIACVLGGQDRRTLFCISAQTTHENLMKGQSAARIDAMRVTTAGSGSP